MPTIDMQDTNRRAIVALDAGDISHAERLLPAIIVPTRA